MELAIGGNEYRVGKLDAFKQFHVARRLAPALLALGTAAAGVFAAARTAAAGDDLAALGPFVGVISQMSDTDSQYILLVCLGVCHRRQGNAWAPVVSASGGMLFDDIDLPTMIQVAVAVIRENIGNFFVAPQIQESGAAQSPA
jgi:hypothetical protein